ncbi:hypothetical protein BC830DRAFT_313194 [Chytriomyces sp. MP71]|nr:hypothetical protein BC830DRAFT_313194 [Chytriomyces sp. MP71]
MMVMTAADFIEVVGVGDSVFRERGGGTDGFCLLSLARLSNSIEQRFNPRLSTSHIASLLLSPQALLLFFLFDYPPLSLLRSMEHPASSHKTSFKALLPWQSTTSSERWFCTTVSPFVFTSLMSIYRRDFASFCFLYSAMEYYNCHRNLVDGYCITSSVEGNRLRGFHYCFNLRASLFHTSSVPVPVIIVRSSSFLSHP